MIKWFREKHNDFMQTYDNHNLAEVVFASIKKQFGNKIKAKGLAAQTVKLFARILSYKMTV